MNRDLESELRTALAVEPSPEFVARLRSRIAGEPAPSAWRWASVRVAGALTAAAAVLLLIWPSHERSSLGFVGRSPLTARAIDVPPVSTPAPPLFLASARPSEAEWTAASSEPVMLMEPREAAALHRLIGKLQPIPVALRIVGAVDDAGSTEPLRAPSEIVVSPIAALSPLVIEPLTVAAREEGARQ